MTAAFPREELNAMAKHTPIELEVIRTTSLTEHMLRVTLGGDALASFPEDQESAYIKLIFPQGEGQRPLLRTYTIRNQRPTEIDVDFALHNAKGPALTWAVNAQPGDRILVGGPGPKKLIQHQADWFLLAGDMSALPAISVNLSKLPADAVGYAVIEVPSESDIQSLDHPEKMELRWEINPHPDPNGEFLPSKIEALPWLDGTPAVWAACEFNSMRNLRRLLKQRADLPNSHLYLSSYWKIGQTEDEHKVAKRNDSEQDAAAVS